MQQDYNPIFWLTNRIIENDILSKTNWKKGWTALLIHKKNCSHDNCPHCLIYDKVIQAENEFHDFMLQQAVFTTFELNNKQFDVYDYYQYWAEEYRKPAQHRTQGEERKAAILTIDPKASTSADLKKVLKKFARGRAINLVKTASRRRGREVFMKASLAQALAQKIDVQADLEEQYATQEAYSLLPIFIQKSTQVDPKATFAFVVTFSPELLKDYPHLIDQSIQKGDIKQVRQQVLDFIQHYQTQTTGKPPFLPTISSMMGLKRDDIHNWYRKSSYKKFLLSWRTYLSGE